MLHACILLRQYDRTIFERVISPFHLKLFINSLRGHRDRMVVGFTYAIGAYHHYHWELKSCSWRGVLDSTLCDKVC